MSNIDSLTSKIQTRWIILAAIIFLLLLLHHIRNLILANGFNVPFWDEIEIVPLLHAHNFGLNLNFLQFLWGQHNEHRVVLPALLYSINYYFFSFNETPLIIIQILTQLALLILLSWQLTKLFSLSSKIYWLLLIGFSALLLAPQMISIWLWPATWVYPILSLLFCATIFSVKFSETSVTDFLLTCILAILTTCTIFNGLMIWPALIVSLWLGKATPRRILLFLLVGAVVNGMYFYHYHSVRPLIQVSLLERIQYFLCFIGAMFSWLQQKVAIYISAAGILLYLINCFGFFSKKNTLEEKRKILPWFAIALLPFSSALLGAFGRIYAGVGQAFSDRYLPISAVFWCSLLVCTFYLWRKNILYRSLLSKILVGFFVLMLMHYYHLTATTAIGSPFPYRQIRLAEMALRYNVYVVNTSDVNGWGQLLANRPAALATLQLLKENKFSVFSEKKPTINLGHNISEYGLTKISTQLPGKFLAVNTDRPMNTCIYSFKPGLFASGYIENKFGKVKIENIYLLDNKGEIFGLGLLDTPNFENQPWLGFVDPSLVGANQGSIPLNAYIKFNGDNQLHPLAGTQYLSGNVACIY